MKPLPKFLIEIGPLLAFFIGNWKGGVFWGTGIFMVAIAIALAASWILTKKIAKVPLFSAIFVGIFGGLTIWLHDDTFIKVKVTLINVFFGATLLGGLYFGKLFIKYVVGEAINLPQEAWRALTLRWGVFFLVCGCPQRTDLAECQHRHVGQLQGVRTSRADPGIRTCERALHGQAHDRG